MIKAKRLKPGDQIAFLALSSGIGSLFLHRLRQAQHVMEKLGYKVKLFPSVYKNMSFGGTISYAGSPNECADELMEAFKDPSIRAIVCTIGGYISHELIEFIDFQVIQQYPKIFCGFSDITSLHMAIYSKTSLVTFYGPNAITQFGEFPSMDQYTLNAFQRSVTSVEPLGSVVASADWTDDKTANWLYQEDMFHRRKRKLNKGYRWLREGQAKGMILGGCLPQVLNISGTKYCPKFTHCILLLEIPESDKFNESLLLDHVNVILGHFVLNETFAKIQGLVIGRAFGYTEKELDILHKMIMYHTRNYTFPILYGIDSGHTDPMLTIPFGVQVELNSIENIFTILESGVI